MQELYDIIEILPEESKYKGLGDALEEEDHEYLRNNKVRPKRKNMVQTDTD